MHQISNICKRWGIVSAFVLAAILAITIIPGKARADKDGWIVQFGTAAVDAAGGIAVRGHDVYVSGRTGGTLPGQTSAGGTDVYVRKYNSRGELQWTHQFGTPGDDQPVGGLRARGQQVVVGGFVTGALPDQTPAGGNDAFLRAYDREGNILWALQFGTPQNDRVRDIAIAEDGSIFVSGQTEGQLTEEPNAGSWDAFVMRLDADGTVRWLRQFGTSGQDEAIGIAVTNDAVYVTGPTNGAFPGYVNAGDFDIFVVRLTLDGETEWLTQFGTPAFDATWRIGVAGPTIFLAGHTRGAFPGEISFGDQDGLVAALGHDGQLAWVRQFGTAGCDQMQGGLAVDAEGAVWAGQVGGVLTPGQGCGGSASDAFVQKYDAQGNVLWSTQFGTTLFDNANGVALKGSDVYLAGATDGELGGPNAGGRDAFVMRIRGRNEHHEDEEDSDEDDD